MSYSKRYIHAHFHDHTLHNDDFFPLLHSSSYPSMSVLMIIAFLNIAFPRLSPWTLISILRIAFSIWEHEIRLSYVESRSSFEH